MGNLVSARELRATGGRFAQPRTLDSVGILLVTFFAGVQIAIDKVQNTSREFFKLVLFDHVFR